jgi:hypothetical protein
MMNVDWALGISMPDNELANTYDSFLQTLLGSALWSQDEPGGRRIPWQALEQARSQFKNELSSPGVYLFGADESPMYIGQTGASLLSRLRRRYTRGSYAQFQLAVDHGDVLKTRGYEGLPREVLEWYTRSLGKSRVRLRHAAEFAKAGIESVWIALGPTRDKHGAKELERRLVPIANAWNRRHGLPDLLNVQHAKYR